MFSQKHTTLCKPTALHWCIARVVEFTVRLILVRLASSPDFVAMMTDYGALCRLLPHVPCTVMVRATVQSHVAALVRFYPKCAPSTLMTARWL